MRHLLLCSAAFATLAANTGSGSGSGSTTADTAAPSVEDVAAVTTALVAATNAAEDATKAALDASAKANEATSNALAARDALVAAQAAPVEYRSPSDEVATGLDTDTLAATGLDAASFAVLSADPDDALAAFTSEQIDATLADLVSLDVKLREVGVSLAEVLYITTKNATGFDLR